MRGFHEFCVEQEPRIKYEGNRGLNMLYKIGRTIIDYILPQRCFSCSELSQDSGGFCGKCWSDLDFITSPLCMVCGRKFALDLEHNQTCLACIKEQPSYDNARALFKFDESSKGLIHAFKYYDKTILARKFAQMMKARYSNEMIGADLIVPVPMHKLKRLMRMYNQAGILALELGKAIQKPVLQDILVKKKWTSPQTLMSYKARLKNISGSIAVKNKHTVTGKKVILVDDVMTTGTTVSLCASELKKAGAISVFVACVAST
jgi:competence protein ComFC